MLSWSTSERSTHGSQLCAATVSKFGTQRTYELPCHELIAMEWRARKKNNSHKREQESPTATVHDGRYCACHRRRGTGRILVRSVEIYCQRFDTNHPNA